MKKYILFIFIFIIVSVTKANAILPVGFYFGAKGSQYIGTHSNNNKYNLDINDSSFSPSFVVGARLLDLRAELEYMYRFNSSKISNGIKNKKFDTDIKMLNVYYDFFEFLFFKLYANAGIGKYDIKTSLVETDNSKVWNVGIGTTFSLLNILNVDAGIRHVNMGKMKYIDKTSKQSFEEIYAGIRFGI